MSVDPVQGKSYLPPAYVPGTMRNVPPVQPPQHKGNLRLLASVAGGTLAVTALNAMGDPQGLITATMQQLPQTALLFGGPLALAVLATSYMGGNENLEMQSLVAGGITVAGMMIVGMLPRVIDRATLITVGATAAGVYGGNMLAAKL